MTRARPIPTFALYGEQGASRDDGVHVEEIQSRSRLYRWEIDAHVHRALYQAVCVLEGPAEVSLDEQRVRIEGSGVVVIPPGVVHAFRFGPSTRGHVLTLGAQWLLDEASPAARGAFARLFHAPRVLRLDAATLSASRLEGLLGEFAAAFRAGSPAGSPLAGWLARAVLWRLAELAERIGAGGAQARRHHATLTRFLLLVESHCLEHWPVTRYASELGMSVERLNRLVRAECGTSALEFVHRRIAREACRRLVYVTMPIARIGYELGFADAAYFCRFFKRHTGTSPSAYRRSHAVPAAAS